jgi:hypothetical protein
MKSHLFKSKLFTIPGKGGWTFAPVPKKHAPKAKLAWGRTPVIAVMNGKEWRTSVWTEKSGRVLLPIPRTHRGKLGDGDTVLIEITYLL